MLLCVTRLDIIIWLCDSSGRDLDAIHTQYMTKVSFTIAATITNQARDPTPKVSECDPQGQGGICKTGSSGWRDQPHHRPETKDLACKLIFEHFSHKQTSWKNSPLNTMMSKRRLFNILVTKVGRLTLFRWGLEVIRFILNHHCGDQCLLKLGSWSQFFLL